MRISRIEIIRTELPLKRPFRIAIGLTEVSKSIFVRVHAEGGPYGMGEANIFTPVVGETTESGLAAAQAIAGTLIGSDATDIETRTRQMQAMIPGHPTTRSAFDMAFHDLLGKAAGLPLFKLFGGSGTRALTTDNTVGLESPETMADIAAEFADAGFPAIKIKLGTSVEDDIARLEAIRKRVGPGIALRVDANQGWNRVTAIQALDAIAIHSIEYCEQPVAAWDVDGLARVRARASIPIMADESLFDDHDAIRLVRADACDYFNIKLAKSGGLRTAGSINAIAEGAGIPCMIGCMTETRLGLSAAAHLMSARNNILFADLDGGHMLRDDPVIDGMTYHQNGGITLPNLPGLGADLDEGFLKKWEPIVVS